MGKPRMVLVLRLDEVSLLFGQDHRHLIFQNQDGELYVGYFVATEEFDKMLCETGQFEVDQNTLDKLVPLEEFSDDYGPDFASRWVDGITINLVMPLNMFRRTAIKQHTKPERERKLVCLAKAQTAGAIGHDTSGEPNRGRRTRTRLPGVVDD